jgi:hypothetical protein
MTRGATSRRTIETPRCETAPTWKTGTRFKSTCATFETKCDIRLTNRLRHFRNDVLAEQLIQIDEELASRRARREDDDGDDRGGDKREN